MYACFKLQGIFIFFFPPSFPFFDTFLCKALKKTIKGYKKFLDQLLDLVLNFRRNFILDQTS